MQESLPPSQSLDLQLKALKEVGCERIFTGIASGAKTERLGLEEVEMILREGDTFVVVYLETAFPSRKHTILN